MRAAAALRAAFCVHCVQCASRAAFGEAFSVLDHCGSPHSQMGKTCGDAAAATQASDESVHVKKASGRHKPGSRAGSFKLRLDNTEALIALQLRLERAESRLERAESRLEQAERERNMAWQLLRIHNLEPGRRQ